MANTMKFEILEDGTISIKTDDMSGTNHVSADELLKQIGELAGGKVTTKKRWDIYVPPVHQHKHVHEGGEGHHHH